MAYIDCDKCSHGCVCAYRHQYDDHIVTCSHWKPVAEARKLTHQKIVSELDGADVFLRGRATSKTASLNEYDIEVLLGIANVCDEAADFIQRQKAENERLTETSEEAVSCFHRMESLYNIKCMELKVAKTEAYKEFAERLKASAFECDVSFGYGREHYTEAVAVVEIDTLVKEMTEDKP